MYLSSSEWKTENIYGEEQVYIKGYSIIIQTLELFREHSKMYYHVSGMRLTFLP